MMIASSLNPLIAVKNLPPTLPAFAPVIVKLSVLAKFAGVLGYRTASAMKSA